MQFADNNNKTDVFEKLDYYRKNLEVARRVAVSGYLHAMKYHRAANLIDYVRAGGANLRLIRPKIELLSSESGLRCRPRASSSSIRRSGCRSG